eukprot:1744655-Amphidinium_carterae.1
MTNTYASAPVFASSESDSGMCQHPAACCSPLAYAKLQHTEPAGKQHENLSAVQRARKKASASPSCHTYHPTHTPSQLP